MRLNHLRSGKVVRFVWQQLLTGQDGDPRLALLFEDCFLFARCHETALEQATVWEVALEVVCVHLDGRHNTQMAQAEHSPLLARHFQRARTVLCVRKKYGLTLKRIDASPIQKKLASFSYLSVTH